MTTTRMGGPSAAPDLASYDRIALAFSAGKDSLACLLHLLGRGLPASRIELHHHDVDGGGDLFMDWACSRACPHRPGRANGRLLLSGAGRSPGPGARPCQRPSSADG